MLQVPRRGGEGGKEGEGAQEGGGGGDKREESHPRPSLRPFIGGKTEAQGGKGTYPRSHDGQKARLPFFALPRSCTLVFFFIRSLSPPSLPPSLPLPLSFFSVLGVES
jgi:hypothetical protein